MTGALEWAMVCSVVVFEAWETSTMIPTRFISSMAQRPWPPCRGSSGVFESPSWLWRLWVMLM